MPRLHRLARTTATTVAAALLLAACGAAEADGYDVADRVIETAEQVPLEPQAVIESDCERTVTTDEYGFEAEVVTCADSTASPSLPEPVIALQPGDPLVADDLLAAPGHLPTWVYLPLAETIPDETIRSGFVELSEVLDTYDAACGTDFEAWKASLATLSARSAELTDLINEGRLEDYVGTTTARAFARSYRERTLTQTGCGRPGGAESLTADALVADGDLDFTSEAATTIDETQRSLAASDWGSLFHFYSSQYNYEWMRSAQDPIDLVVFGTSQAGAAIEVQVLSDELDLEVGNAFLPGSLAEVQEHWIPEVERYIDPPLVVWLMGGLDFLVSCEVGGRDTQFTRLIDQRSKTFAAGGWFRGIDPIAIILGPAAPPNGVNGNGNKKPSPDPEAIEAHRIDYTDRFAAASYCVERSETTARIIERLVANGRQVVVVGMPMSPTVASITPGGQATIDDAMTRLDQEYLAPAGAEFIDLTGSMQDDPELWADYTHLTQTGANTFTRLIADELRAIEQP